MADRKELIGRVREMAEAWGPYQGGDWLKMAADRLEEVARAASAKSSI